MILCGKRKIKCISFASMKFLNYILAFYFILLAVVPCCAFDNCPDEKPVAQQEAKHQNGDKDCGTCSPFFNCESCASVTLDVTTIHIDVYMADVNRMYASFIPSFVSGVHYDFWQPPRLV